MLQHLHLGSIKLCQSVVGVRIGWHFGTLHCLAGNWLLGHITIAIFCKTKPWCLWEVSEWEKDFNLRKTRWGANIVKNIALEHDWIQAQKGRRNRFSLALESFFPFSWTIGSGEISWTIMLRLYFTTGKGGTGRVNQTKCCTVTLHYKLIKFAK